MSLSMDALAAALHAAFAGEVSEHDYHNLVRCMREYKEGMQGRSHLNESEVRSITAVGWPDTYNPLDHMERIRFCLVFGKENARVRQLLGKHYSELPGQPANGAGFVRCYKEHVDPYLEAHGIAPHVALVYKGGNVIVDYVFELLAKKANTRMRDMLQRTDIDFQVAINDARVYATHIDQIHRLVLQAVYDFREQVAKHMREFRAKAKIDISHYKNADPSILDKLPSSMERGEVVPHADMLILDPNSRLYRRMLLGNGQRENHKCASLVIRLPHLLEGHEPQANDGMYVSFNNALRIDLGHGRLAAFDLMRLKLNVRVRLKDGSCVTAPAELLDVSFKTPQDSAHMLGRAFEDWTQWKTLRIGVEVRVPTLEHIVTHELEDILWRQQAFPWGDPKYSKRLRRYVLCLALLCLGITDEEADTVHPDRTRDLIESLKRFQEYLDEVLQDVSVGESVVASARPSTIRATRPLSTRATRPLSTRATRPLSTRATRPLSTRPTHKEDCLSRLYDNVQRVAHHVRRDPSQNHAFEEFVRELASTAADVYDVIVNVFRPRGF